MREPAAESGFWAPPEAGKRRSNWPLAHVRSLRDNANYRASFACRVPHRGPLRGRPRRFRRQHRNAAAGHLRDLESPRVGKAGIALSGPGRARLFKGWGRRLSKPQRQFGALTADVLAVIRLTTVQPRRRGRGIETPEQAAQRGKFDVALVAALSDAGLRRSEAAALTWGDVQRWDDGSGRITVIRSKTDAEAQGAVVAITLAAMKALNAIRPVGMARRMAQNGAPTHEIERQGRWKQDGRHGRPLHPRRIRWVGAAVSVTVYAQQHADGTSSLRDEDGLAIWEAADKVSSIRPNVR